MAASDKTGNPNPSGPERERSRLERGMREIGLAADPVAVERLLVYIALVRKWTRAYNLVARRDLGALVNRHVLDSLAIHPHVRPGTLLDVGSGAGLPGLPLAIARPDLDVILLESAGKKARFLRQAVRTLGLDNAEPVEERLERFRSDRPLVTITSRAFASLRDLAIGVRHLASRDTRVLAMKGRRPDHELQELPDWAAVTAVERIHVPDLHAERHLVIMCLSAASA